MSSSAGDVSRPVIFRGRGFEPRSRPLVSWVFLIAVLATWQASSALGLVGELALPSPLRVARSFYELIETGDLWGHLAASLGRIALGWGLGFSGGLALGLGMGTFTVARSVGLPLVSALFPIPKIALLPLFILWFGIGEASKIATIAFGVFFPTAVSTYGAVDAVARDLVRMGQAFELSPRAIVRKIIVPGSLPGILSGARISASIALILVVAAEMIGAERGVGALILTAGHLMQTDRLLAGVLVLSFMGLLVSSLIGRLETWLLRWR